MPAKSLGTLPVICAVDELQNPRPLKTMLFGGHIISTIGISDAFPNSKGGKGVLIQLIPWLLIQHCMRREGGLYSRSMPWK